MRKKIEERITKELDSVKPLLDSMQSEQYEEDVIREYLRHLEDLFNYEETRNGRVETKATTILSASGLIATFVFGLVAFLQKSLLGLNTPILFIASALLLLALICLFLTIFFSIRVHQVKTYAFPCHIESILGALSVPISDLLKQRLRDLTISIKRNIVVVNSKVDDLIQAQRFFSLSITVLIITTVLTIIYTAYHLSC